MLKTVLAARAIFALGIVVHVVKQAIFLQPEIFVKLNFVCDSAHLLDIVDRDMVTWLCMAMEDIFCWSWQSYCKGEENAAAK